MKDSQPPGNRRNGNKTTAGLRPAVSTETPESTPPRENNMSLRNSRHATAPRRGDPMASLDFLKAALDDVQSNLLIADLKLNLIYANPRAIETLGGLEAELRRAFRGRCITN